MEHERFTTHASYHPKILRHPQILGLPSEGVFVPLPYVATISVRRIRFYLVFALIVAAAGELDAQGILIPDTTRRDMVFDFAGHNLYISTSTGLIKTFDLSTF